MPEDGAGSFEGFVALVLAAIHANHGDDVIAAHFLGDDFRTRYTELSGIDYWA